MKVSLKWLQTYFDAALPSADVLADVLTFHVAEIEELTADYLDVKVLPDRAAYMLSHRGVASEVGAILDLPLKEDPLRTQLSELPPTNELSVSVDPTLCNRYMGALVKGVSVGPSPDWLKEALEAVGQRSINNVVDATNYVMLNTGQPLHAFDAGKLTKKGESYGIEVRVSKEGENITTLTGEEYVLPIGTLLIVDAHTDAPIGIAGIKGGKFALVDESTADLVIESASFEASGVRRSTQALKLFTDASARFQNNPSAELVAYGMRDVLALITEIAGGDVTGTVDEYPNKEETTTLTTTVSGINARLGASYDDETVRDVLSRLGMNPVVASGSVTVTPPFERRDIRIPDDLAEEVGRVLGYDTLPSLQLPPLGTEPDQARFRGIERMKDQLIEQGFTEVSTQSFAKKGDVKLANPLDATKPYLRTSLEENLTDALTRAKLYAPLVLAPNQKPKLFEVGTVFDMEGEHVELRMTERVPEWGDSAGTVDNLSIAKLDDYGRDYTPVRYAMGTYVSFSSYPFIVRDISMWVPEGKGDVSESRVSFFSPLGDGLIQRVVCADQFTKDARTSIAFRLVFQSHERTLTDEEVNKSMENISTELKKDGYDIR